MTKDWISVYLPWVVFMPKAKRGRELTILSAKDLYFQKHYASKFKRKSKTNTIPFAYNFEKTIAKLSIV